MSERESRTFVLEAEGDTVALDQLHTLLKGVAEEGNRQGVNVDVEQKIDRPEEAAEFENESLN